MSIETNEGKPTVIRCGIYARTAAMLQHGHTVGNQITECKRMAREKGWQVVDHCIWSDAGKSGTSFARRTGLQQLLARAETQPRPFEILLCESVSRLSRNLSDIVAIEDTLRRNGIQLTFVQDELRSSIFDWKSTLGWSACQIQSLMGACTGLYGGYPVT